MSVRLIVLICVFIVPLVFAADYKARIVDTGSFGSEYRFEWRQGCSGPRLGPNACASTRPLWCPITSTGWTGLTSNSGRCGCPTNQEPDDDGIFCVACASPCERIGCPDGQECTDPDEDWCTNPDPICEEPELPACPNSGGLSCRQSDLCENLAHADDYTCSREDHVCCHRMGDPPPPDECAHTATEYCASQAACSSDGGSNLGTKDCTAGRICCSVSGDDNGDTGGSCPDWCAGHTFRVQECNGDVWEEEQWSGHCPASDPTNCQPGDSLGDTPKIDCSDPSDYPCSGTGFCDQTSSTTARCRCL